MTSEEWGEITLEIWLGRESEGIGQGARGKGQARNGTKLMTND
jgi:hypothetical protein